MIIKKIINWLRYQIDNKIKFQARKILIKSINSEPIIQLQEKHINDTKIYMDRLDLLEKCLPKNSVCAEVGIANGDFSKKIIDIIEPKTFHLVELSKKYINICREKFRSEISNGTVSIHEGYSDKILSQFPDQYFDWIYIDGDHSYNVVKKDLFISKEKIKSDGLIMLDDYVNFSHQEMLQYGVMRAVNEFCCDENFRVVGLTISEKSIIKNNILGKKVAMNEYTNIILKRI